MDQVKLVEKKGYVLLFHCFIDAFDIPKSLQDNVLLYIYHLISNIDP